MKIKYPSIFGVLAILMLVASFVVPARLASPAPAEALNAICQWDVVPTPGMVAGLSMDIRAVSEVNQIVIGPDGKTFWIVDNAANWPVAIATLGMEGDAFKTVNGGVSWSNRQAGTSGFGYLRAILSVATNPGGYPIWYMAVAPDDVNFVIAVVDKSVAPASKAATEGPGEIYVSEDGGITWQNTNFVVASGLAALEFVSCLDISMKYGNQRDVLVGTRTGAAGGRLFLIKAPGYTSWVNQLTVTPPIGVTTMDFYAAKFSPTYTGDASIVAVASPNSNPTNTYLYMGLRD